MSDENTQGRYKSGSSILLRLPNEFASTLRRVAKQEERNITTIALRAFRLYFKEEHNIEVKEEQD